MTVFNRYTIEKWKEYWGTAFDNRSASLSRLYALFNTSLAARFMSLGCLIVLILLVSGLFSLLKSNPSAPVAKQLTLTETDAKGDIWTMDYLKNQNIQAILDGDTKPGQPLTLKIKFHRKSQTLLMKPEIIGVAGEQYFPGTVKNGQWQPAPNVVIADQNGKRLHRGQFEYG